MVSAWMSVHGVAQTAGVAAPADRPLLVIAALLCASLLVIAIFSLWQSHRMYMDTVRLHQDMTEAQHALLERVRQVLQTARARPATSTSPNARTPAPASAPVVQPPVVQPRAAQPGVAQPRTKADNGGGSGDPLEGLSDVEFAVLEKLVADPAYFTQHSLGGFGASQDTISALLRRGLAKLDGLGRPTVPDDVRAALRVWFPGS